MIRALLHAAAVMAALKEPSQGHGPVTPPACPGRSIVALAQLLGSPSDRALSGPLARPLIALWKAEHQAADMVPEQIHVLLGPAEPLVVALTAGLCVIDAIPMSRRQLAELLRRAVGPAV